MPADNVMTVSVVVERRATGNPWQDQAWRPVGVLPHDSEERGKLLAEGDGWALFQGGTLPLELVRGETEGYLINLSQEVPRVFVVLRRNEEADDLEFEPFLATVCPYEAMGYSGGNDDVVEGVPMPPEIADWVRAFVTQHHVDTPFLKRKNKRHRDDFGGKRPPDDGERGVP